ncbi:hypothetical protein V2I75_26440 [Pseudomonas viridiflava]|uniref:hypothetical protein n=1 Tax=Pseudomonas viridiflava TaxID=33069 RepID=UPI002EB95C28|nr:hypothetical protein [Pseudomonas viridiflava]
MQVSPNKHWYAVCSFCNGAGTKNAIAQVTKREVAQKLDSLDKGTRAEGVRSVLRLRFSNISEVESEALVARIAELGEEHPDQALRTMGLLLSLDTPAIGSSNLVPAIAAGIGAMVALSAALSTTTATPEGLDRLRAAANAVAKSVAESGQSTEQQVSTSIEIWKFLFSTTFPVHLLDGDNSRLVNPMVQTQGANPSSGGYAAGATPAPASSTGGSQIADQTPVDYSRPIEALPAPGVMNQDESDSASTGQQYPDENLIPLTAEQIFDINKATSGEGVELTGAVSTVLTNMYYRDGFSEQAATIIRDIAGSHLFKDGNKRTAQAVVEAFAKQNGIVIDLQGLRDIVDEAGKGSLGRLSTVDLITKRVPKSCIKIAKINDLMLGSYDD